MSHRSPANAVAGLTAMLIVASPALAEACAVCGAGRDEAARGAFIATTVFLTLLPLLAIGGAVLWLRRRARRLAEQSVASAGSRAPVRT